MTWTLSSLSIHGVKAVLDRAGDFTLTPKKGKPRSIAIFGRNGYGKSGYADAIEYLFSIDGEVEHLGKGDADSEHGGKHAIPHVLAGEKGIASEITVEFTHLETGKKISTTRPIVTGRSDARPAEIDSLVLQSPAHRILRQHDLRRFVVDMAPGEKFAEFARWIGLEGTAKLLSYLTTTERTLKETDVDREISERLKSIESHTSGAIKSFDLEAILKWCEGEVTKHVGQFVPIQTSSAIENAIQTLRARREQLLFQSQAAQAYIIRSSLEKAANALAGDKGQIRSLDALLSKVIQAEQNKDEVQSKASQSVFQDVWESAQKVLESEKPEICPVCQTPWGNTTVGSSDNALVILTNSLSSLTQFKAANGSYLQQYQILRNALQSLEQSLTEITGFAKTLALTSVVDEAAKLQSTCAELRRGTQTAQELNTPLAELSANCLVFTTQSIPRALSALKLEGAPASVSGIDTAMTHLQGLREAVSRLEALREQQIAIRTVEQQFSKVADTIRRETKTLAENVVKALRADVEKIYKQIHPGEAVPNVFIDMDADRKTLTIRVNFHSSERKVPPGGYLSEAQINTLGLALFLGAVRLFNKEFPFVVLDDIVSSYDADNRARIVEVLAEYMDGFQIFLTTHDERFYVHLKQRLEGENWLFEKISGYEFDKGPRRESDNLRPAQIDELIKEGDARIAGNAVRQFMEEWFDKMSEKYQVYTLHRRDSREYQRTLSDFWQPFLDKVQKLGAGFGPRFSSSVAYQRLKGDMLINYYSHHQANPYEWSAIGDVKYVWETFQEFTKLFNCHSCSKLLKYDTLDTKLYCTCGGVILPPVQTITSQPK